MKNIGQKIKDAAAAITPGSTHKHEETTTGAGYGTSGLGGGYETGTTGTTGYGTSGVGGGYETGTAGYGATTTGAGSEVERRTEEAAAAEAAATGQPAVAQTVTTAAAAPVREHVSTGQEAVCDAQFFTKTEDRPIVHERVEYIKEHRPVEKEFVVETRATGVEREVAEGRTIEHLGTTERIVSEAAPKGPCE